MKSGEKDKNYSWKECSCYFYRIEHMFGGCKECAPDTKHTLRGEGSRANCDNKESCQSGAQRNFTLSLFDEAALFTKFNYSPLDIYLFLTCILRQS